MKYRWNVGPTAAGAHTTTQLIWNFDFLVYCHDLNDFYFESKGIIIKSKTWQNDAMEVATYEAVFVRRRGGEIRGVTVQPNIYTLTPTEYRTKNLFPRYSQLLTW